MNERPDDWGDLTDAWTAPTTEGREADPTRRARTRELWGRINYWGEAAGCVVGGSVGVWAGVMRGSLAIAVASLVFCGLGLALTVWARRGVDPVRAGTPAGALRAERALATSGLRWARAGQMIAVAAAGFVAVVARDGGGVDAWLVVGGALALGVALALYERHARRCRVRLANAERMLEELETEG